MFHYADNRLIFVENASGSFRFSYDDAPTCLETEESGTKARTRVKIKNTNLFARLVALVFAIGFLIAVIILFVKVLEQYRKVPTEHWLLLPVATLISLWYVIVCARSWYSFHIHEKGITRKLLGRSVFTAWDEFKYIGVGEVFYLGEYSFVMYFSKIAPKRIYFNDVQDMHTSQNKWHFFIEYNQEGMLEEILKYVDEERIKDVERIKTAPNPHEPQPAETSEMLRQEEEEVEEFKRQQDKRFYGKYKKEDE
jgi:hypothetical protein